MVQKTEIWIFSSMAQKVLSCILLLGYTLLKILGSSRTPEHTACFLSHKASALPFHASYVVLIEAEKTFHPLSHISSGPTSQNSHTSKRSSSTQTSNTTNGWHARSSPPYNAQASPTSNPRLSETTFHQVSAQLAKEQPQTFIRP
jgi:hypothetical protein